MSSSTEPGLAAVSSRLAILSRAPAVTGVKTRLAREVGGDAAERLFRAMIGDLFANLEGAPLELVVYLASQQSSSLDQKAFRDAGGWRGALRPQPPGHLGARIARAFADAFHEKEDRVLVIGTDSPQLDTAAIVEASETLEHTGIVLGPATDGGFYLIGASRAGYRPELLQQVPWGTSGVLDATKQRVHAAGVSLTLLPELMDLDTIGDVRRFVGSPRSMNCPRLRVVAAGLESPSGRCRQPTAFGALPAVSPPTSG